MPLNALVLVLNNENEIIEQFDADFNTAMFAYHGQRDSRGNRYYVVLKGKNIPFKRKKKELKDIINNSKKN